MNSISTENPAQEITRLHDEVLQSTRKSVENMIRIGELLAEQKSNLPHGRWAQWLKDNVPFSGRTARRYLALYENRDQLKTDNVANLADAYRVIAEGGESCASPMTFSEAKEAETKILEGLANLLEETRALLVFRDQKGYEPEFQTFEAWLVSRGSSGDLFRRLVAALDSIAARERGEEGSPSVIEIIYPELFTEDPIGASST